MSFFSFFLFLSLPCGEIKIYIVTIGPKAGTAIAVDAECSELLWLKDIYTASSWVGDLCLCHQACNRRRLGFVGVC